MTRYSIWV